MWLFVLKGQCVPIVVLLFEVDVWKCNMMYMLHFNVL